MSRPTDDKKGSTIILRINEETRQYLEEKAQGRTLSAYVRDMIQAERDGSQNNVIQNPQMKEIEGMCTAFKIPTEEFLKKLSDAMIDGVIGYENGKFKSYIEEEYDLSRFKDACEYKGVSVQKMIDKATQMVWSS